MREISPDSKKFKLVVAKRIVKDYLCTPKMENGGLLGKKKVTKDFTKTFKIPGDSESLESQRSLNRCNDSGPADCFDRGAIRKLIYGK